MAGASELDLGDNGGRFTFRDWDAARSWLEKERQAWSWLNAATSEPTNIKGSVANAFNAISNAITQNISAGNPPASITHTVQHIYARGYEGLLHSEGAVGALVLDIFTTAGAEAAAFAYAFAQQRQGVGNATTLEHVRGVMLMACPAIQKPDQLADRLSKERSNLRGQARRLVESLEVAGEERKVAWSQQIARERRLYARWMRSRGGMLNRLDLNRQTRIDQAVTDIRGVEAAYREAMALQAPVEYWKAKALAHSKAETGARQRLYWFFPLAIFLLVATFGGTSWALLNAPEQSVPAALYVIVSGGLASLAGIAFWIGRLLTKLYLSEHHLCHDAEERAVMTTTYLALTRERAADEGDRQIVLNALFRSTPDGIVRDDGPPDTNIAALLARLGAGRN